ncbi:MAG TPA: hypothetical protein VF522_18360 [Ramlibacter sp.]|uniref:hypothetical protein n=1 Tax=Ramlibacter sp. TaxID=1917967 RepID=UPI002ED3E609
MASLSRMTGHAVHRMAPEDREALARELFAVHSQIFAGLDYQAFRGYVVNRDSWRTWIYTKHNAAGQLVGYTALHFFRMQVEGRPCTVLRMEAGTLPAWRGRDLTMVHGLLRLMRVWLNEPWRPFCIFAALTHPSSYTHLSHYAPVVWPHAQRPEMPPRILGILEELAGAFKLQRVYPENPLIRRVDWITLESAEERARWTTSRRPDTRFYVDRNPGFAQGHGLATYIPVNGLLIVRAMARFLVGRAGTLARVLFGHAPAASGEQPALVQRATKKVAHPRHPEFAHTRPPSL